MYCWMNMGGHDVYYNMQSVWEGLAVFTQMVKRGNIKFAGYIRPTDDILVPHISSVGNDVGQNKC